MTLMFYRSVPGGWMEVRFPGERFAGLVTTDYVDGARAVFNPAFCDDKTTQAARLVGYGDRIDWFAVHHEMTHHFVAMALRWPTSTIVWQTAHGGRKPVGWGSGWPYCGWDEEHIVNSLLAHLQSGTEDGSGIVRSVWGNGVPLLLSHLSAWLRPWTVAPSGDPPLPLNPAAVSRPISEQSDLDWRDHL